MESKENFSFIDISEFSKEVPTITTRSFELSELNITDLNVIESNRLVSFFSLILNQFSRRARAYFFVGEEQFHFSELPKLNPFFTYLTGYWQSYKYFELIRDDLAYIFKPLHLDNYSKELIEKLKKNNSLSLHIRRGDYVTNFRANIFHGLCDLDYYNKAVNYIRCIKQVDLICIFSDDIDWVKQNLFIEGVDIIYISEFVIDHIQEFEIMKQCQHNIIANSSFSWWAAFLNSNPEKIVIAPKKWFNDQSINTSDLCPQEWIRL
jgi:hypothetical protein